MGKTNTNWDVVEMFKERANAIDHKEHFRLRKYDVTMKEIAKVRYGSHCKYNINFHFVWVPKTRKKILVEPFRTDLINEIYRISEHYKWMPFVVFRNSVNLIYEICSEWFDKNFHSCFWNPNKMKINIILTMRSITKRRTDTISERLTIPATSSTNNMRFLSGLFSV